MMGKIFYLMGKSSVGKDTIYQKLLENQELKLKKVIMYTTRPIRTGELQGKEYFFVSDKKCAELKQRGKIVELRSYKTCLGVWKYFTVDDGQIALDNGNYIVMGTLESYNQTRTYYGKENVVPIMLILDDATRLQRALDREKIQEFPQYEELCRRFLADTKDFSKEKMKEAGIKTFFENENLEDCLEKIKKCIRNTIY